MEISSMQTLCVFEDGAYTRLLPLTYTRPAYDLVCGLTSLREKIHRCYPECRIVLQCRTYLTDSVRRKNPGIAINERPEGSCLFLNGRILADDRLASSIPLEGNETLYCAGDALAAARIRRETARRIDLSAPLEPEAFPVEERVNVDVDLIRYPWDLIERNGEQVERDFTALIGQGSIGGDVSDRASVLREHKVFIGKGARIRPGAVLDAERGSIYVGGGGIIFPNACVEGPAVIGSGTHVRAGAKISGGTTVGPVCKIGGEIDRSIILGYSNKQHDGYLGHSYVGSWVNLGAGTTNSDLKNNYHTVKVWVNGDLIDTGSLHVGLIMGDHSKSGILSMFNTGTVVGVCCNVFGTDFPSTFIPSFSWGGAKGFAEYDLDKAIETTRTVMARRDEQLSEGDEKILRHVFRITAEERKRAYQS